MPNEKQVERIFGSVEVLKQQFHPDGSAAAAIVDSVPQSMQRYLTPERVLRILTAAVHKNPTLLKCSIKSLTTAVIDAVQLGLEPGGPLGHAYLVPFFNKKIGVMECVLIVGYQGYIALARRSGEIESVFTQIIYSRDDYRIIYGDSPRVTHEPYIPDPENEDAPQDRGKPVGGYCVARYKDGGYHIEVMTVGDIDKIRLRSRAANSGPWVTDWEMMARKTVIRRARHYWPISVEMASAFELDDRGSVSLKEALGETRAALIEEQSKTERLKAELTAGSGGSSPTSEVEPAKAEPQEIGDVYKSVGPPAMTEQENAEARADAEAGF